MTPDKKRKTEAQSKPAAKAKEIMFTCKYCEKDLPLSQMVVVTRFSPPLIACKACEKTEF